MNAPACPAPAAELHKAHEEPEHRHRRGEDREPVGRERVAAGGREPGQVFLAASAPPLGPDRAAGGTGCGPRTDPGWRTLAVSGRFDGDVRQVERERGRCLGRRVAEILDKIGYLVRERFKIFGQIQALTGEGRLSGDIINCPPGDTKN